MSLPTVMPTMLGSERFHHLVEGCCGTIKEERTTLNTDPSSPRRGPEDFCPTPATAGGDLPPVKVTGRHRVGRYLRSRVLLHGTAV